MFAVDQPAVELLAVAGGCDVGFSQYGDRDGEPVIYCHGFPASRLEAGFADVCALSLGLRIVAMDRPGYGRSTSQPHRRLLDWPADVSAVADHLGLSCFAVLGVSGGGPYAVACAERLAERVSGLALVCPLGPLEAAGSARGMRMVPRLATGLARRLPIAVVSAGVEGLSQLLRLRPRLVLEVIMGAAPEPDKRVLSQAEVRQLILSSLAEAFRSGGAGAAQDLLIYTRPWGIRWERIGCPVSLWHGLRDTTVPARMGSEYAARLVDCRARFLPDEGHYSLPVRHMAEILAALKALQ